MVSSRDTTPDPKRATTDNFVKELLDALAEIMDKKVHLESENLELKHKCQSQKQKIEAFKELALGEKAFLLGIIKRECCSACPGRQEECNQEYPVREDDDGKPIVDKKVSVGSAMIDKRTSVSSAAHSEHKGNLNIGVGNECCTDCPCPAQNGIAEDVISLHSKRVSVAPNTNDQQIQTEELAEVSNIILLFLIYVGSNKLISIKCIISIIKLWSKFSKTKKILIIFEQLNLDLILAK